jgi:uncharacterized protein YcbK (DUF882 family)
MDRREFLKFGCKCATLAATACWAPTPLRAGVKRSRAPHSLSLYNTHTGESLGITYAADGAYIPEALEAIDHIMRDHRTGDVKPIDPNLLDVLYAIAKKIGLTPRHPFHIVSGYRSPETNALLRKRSRQVAKNSYHMKGQAVDFRVPRLRLSHLRKAAVSLRVGGVGYYPRSHFLHVDVGEFRCW